MNVFLLVDFGSTFTKVMAVDIDGETVIGRAQAPTTIETDIMLGLAGALEALHDEYGIAPDSFAERLACSSAAGGLKMAAIGLVPALTLEAARRACLNAGAKVVCSYGFEIDSETIQKIENQKCDIIMLAGGTDGGNKNVIIHNAEVLAASNLQCPVLVCGNRNAQSAVRYILEESGKNVYTAENVLPTLDLVVAEPAQNVIREVFIDHIVQARGLSEAQDYIGKNIIPTPLASLLAAELIADGTKYEQGIGPLLVVEIGGATTNIHTVADNEPVNQQAVLRGLPEPRVKRTVEGDLGIRWNSHTIYDMAGQERLTTIFRELTNGNDGSVDFKEYTDRLINNTSHIPESDVEYNMDIALARASAEIAVGRHAGKFKTEPSLIGDITVQYGKNLLNVKNIIGTGGIFKYGNEPGRILKAALFDPSAPESLRPKNPAAWLDYEYILYGVGLLSQQAPEIALRIAKKYLKPYSPDQHYKEENYVF